MPRQNGFTVNLKSLTQIQGRKRSKSLLIKFESFFGSRGDILRYMSLIYLVIGCRKAESSVVLSNTKSLFMIGFPPKSQSMGFTQLIISQTFLYQSF